MLYINHVYLSASGKIRQIAERIILNRNGDPTTEMEEEKDLGVMVSSEKAKILIAAMGLDPEAEIVSEKFREEKQQEIFELHKVLIPKRGRE